MVRKNERGITLIALVISIIILLILAGITILAISGENGIIQRAVEAREKMEETTLEEKIKLITAESIIDEYAGDNEEKTAQEIQNELNRQGENVLVIQWNKYIIYDLDKNKEYRVMSDGTTEYWGESTMGQTLLNTKTANSDQISQDPSTSNLIGIDNDGNTVNMLLWEYTLIDDSSLGKVGTYGLNDKAGLDDSGASGRSAGYIGGYTEDGKILGTVPAYISIDGGNTYTAVTSMVHAFYDCDNLIVAPEIANTVDKMNVCFYQSTNLTMAPSRIPDSVISFKYVFNNCEKLSNVPILGNNIEDMVYSFSYTGITEFNQDIPNSVKNMEGAFSGCANLIKFDSEIPNNVVSLENTFRECTNLKIVPNIIPNSVITMRGTFYNCKSLVNGPTTISNNVTNMQSTFFGCTSLNTIPNVIPSSVTNMMQTFYNCSNLTGTVQINANLSGKIVYTYNERDYKDYEECFIGTSTTGSGLVISRDSTCAELNNLYSTKSSNSNITIEE